jgi:gluconolactonase
VNFDRDGTLYCVDLSGGGIWRMPAGGALREWVRTGGRPNGSRFGPGGDLFVADRGTRSVLRVDIGSGAMTAYADNCAGQPFAGLNDLCFGPDGVLYFTDPEGSTTGNPIGAVYAAHPDGGVTRFAGGLAFPNGVAVSPDAETLVVGETFTGVLRRYSLRATDYGVEAPPLAVLSPAGEANPESGPDGMAYGADGLLYVAHFGTGFVRVFAADGSVAANLPMGGSSATNVAFWQDSLFVTDGPEGSIYRLDIGVREQPPFMRPW